MKRGTCIRSMLVAFLIFPSVATPPSRIVVARDRYRLVMRLEDPRIFNNMESKGYRKYKNDLIQGDLYINYYAENQYFPDVTVTNLVNKSYKLSNGQNVTYKCHIGLQWPYQTRVNVIGSNATGIFKTASVVFHLTADPSYNIGDDGADNTLLLVMSARGWCEYKNDDMYGHGSYVIKRLRGYAAGTIGCGCSVYGHTSPTRVQGMYGNTDQVDDVAAIMGRWYAILYDGTREFDEIDTDLLELLENE